LHIGNADISVTAVLRSDDTRDRYDNFLTESELGYGLVIREPTFPEIGFSVEPDGQWDDWYSNGVSDEHPVNPVIHKGLRVSNVLQIRARGASFEFYVNGAKIGHETVPGAPDSGGIGLYVDGYDSAIFSNLIVKRL
jgi:hypothetical protein